MSRPSECHDRARVSPTTMALPDYTPTDRQLAALAALGFAPCTAHERLCMGWTFERPETDGGVTVVRIPIGGPYCGPETTAYHFPDDYPGSDCTGSIEYETLAAFLARNL